MGWSEAFSKTGPGRLRNRTPEENALADEFRAVFGERPKLQRIPGQRINLRDYAPLFFYDALERDYDGLADVELEELGDGGGVVEVVQELRALVHQGPVGAPGGLGHQLGGRAPFLLHPHALGQEMCGLHGGA